MKELELKAKGEYSETCMKPWETLLTSIENDLSFVGHFDARTLDEAAHLLQINEHKRARLIGGGVDILRTMKRMYMPEPTGVLVNIKTVPGLAYIREESGVLKIGALTTLSDIECSELVKTKCGVLAETAALVGSPQVRNMSTIAGSLCQDVTCWYYRAEKNYYHCLRKGGSSCPAIRGDNRWMFSIFGTDANGCYASCQSDMAITLSALGASVRTTQRVVPIKHFYISTSKGIVLNHNEIITEVQIPLRVNTRAKYTKFSIRKSLDHPLVSVACVANGEDISVAIGGVLTQPYVAKNITDLLSGKKLTARSAEKAGDIAVAGATSLSMNTWKVEVTRVLVKRTLLELL